jgi:transcriptional regulator with XRE-family HTH domain
VKRTFGSVVRGRRQEREITLRGFASMIGISPTYLSKVERGELPPPAPDKIVLIAERLGLDEDDLFALARRIPDDIADIVASRPAVAALLRKVKKVGLSDEDVRQLTLKLEGAGDRRNSSARTPRTKRGDES